MIASLIETCKLNNVEPLGYLADVLTRIVNGHPNRQIDELLPWTHIAKPELKAVARERCLPLMGLPDRTIFFGSLGFAAVS